VSEKPVRAVRQGADSGVAETRPENITEIPDSPSLTAATEGLHIGDDDEIPDIDDIPDMDEAAGLEDDEDEATARPT
jgi:ubiquitin-like-conjugating enzyme ATG3